MDGDADGYSFENKDDDVDDMVIIREEPNKLLHTFVETGLK